MADKTIAKGNYHRRAGVRLARGEKRGFIFLKSALGGQDRSRELQDYQLELKTQKEELQRVKEEASRLYEALYESAPVGYLTLDRAGVIRNGNLLGLQLFGEERKALLGKPFKQWVDNESQEDFQNIHRYVFETGEHQSSDLRLLKKDGSFFHAWLECRPLRDAERRVSRCLIIVRDISQRLAAEIKLQETDTALKVLLVKREEDKVAMEKNILANVRTSVMPYLEKLKRTGLKRDQVQYLQFIETNLENITSSFVNNLSTRYDGFTPREIEIANLVRNGHKTKDIAVLLSISRRSVEFHKDNIRKKMGLTNQKINLQSYLIVSDQR